jgi:hypothetical protein
MNRFIFTVVCFASAVGAIFGQEQRYQSKITLTPNVGVNFPVSKFLRGDVTDNLIGYSHSTVYWQTISGAFYFTKRLGVQLDVQLGWVNKGYAREDQFKREAVEEFGIGKYYVLDASKIELFTDISSYTRSTIGAVYRFEGDRWYCNPKLAIGLITIGSQSGVVFLKEKDTNNIIRVRYDPDDRQYDWLNLVAGMSTGYKLKPRLYINFDLMLNSFHANGAYHKTVVNLFDGASTTDVISYRRNAFSLNASVGAIIVLQKFKEFRNP